MYALFQFNRQVSKPHSTKHAAIIEAIELKVVKRIGDYYNFDEGFEVRPVSQESTK
jgi:hypothetical protein